MIKKFVNKLPDDHFISRYVEMNREKSGAYPEYLFTGGIFLLAVAADRNIRVELRPHPTYLNVEMINLGRSGYSKKTTAQMFSQDVLDLTRFKDTRVSDHFSGEGFLTKLAATPQCYNNIDEYGTFLADAQKNYNLGIKHLFNKLYGCQTFSKTLAKTDFVFTDPYYNLMAGTTTETLRMYLSQLDIQSGFIPRKLFVWPTYDLDFKARTQMTTEDFNNTANLAETLDDLAGSIYNQALEHKYPHPMLWLKPTTIAQEIFDKAERQAHNKIHKLADPEHFGPILARYGDHVLKLAGIFEIGKHSFTPMLDNTIKFDSIRWAIYYMKELFLPSLKAVLAEVFLASKENYGQYILKKLEAHGGKLMHHKLWNLIRRPLKLNAEGFGKEMRGLNAMGLIKETHVIGSKTRWYEIIKQK